MEEADGVSLEKNKENQQKAGILFSMWMGSC